MPELQEVKVTVPGIYGTQNQRRGQAGAPPQPGLLPFMSGQPWKGGSSLYSFFLSLFHSLILSPHLEKLHIRYICRLYVHVYIKNINIYALFKYTHIYTYMCVLYAYYLKHICIVNTCVKYTKIYTYIPLSFFQVDELVEHWKNKRYTT